jgi:hypothetical protein
VSNEKKKLTTMEQAVMIPTLSRGAALPAVCTSETAIQAAMMMKKSRMLVFVAFMHSL